MRKIGTTPKLYNREDAERVAADYQAGDPDWTYRAVLYAGSTDWTDRYVVEVLEAPEGEHIAFVPVDPA